MEIRKLAPGDRVLDYHLVERLGEGGFGEVFRAEHEVLRRTVAIKVPRDEGGVTALRHEGVVQASLEHPGIVRTVELSLRHDPPYVVMEFVDGMSLAEILRREGKLSWRRAARILLEAGRALSYAHSKGVVHGDVKPGNVLVEPGRKGRVMLTDFGLGRVFEGPKGSLQISRSLELATSGAEVQGTIRYLAPELLRGEAVDERADVYSFGVLLFEAVTGRLPEGREVPSDLLPGLPPEFDRMFAQTFTRRERRPSTLSGVITELEGLLDAPPRSKKGEQKQPVVAAIALAPHDSSVNQAGFTRKAPFRPGEEASFAEWRGEVVQAITTGMASKLPHAAPADGQGFDICFGVNQEGEPHHRVYALFLPELDGTKARAVVANARRIFEQEKGIWEKEVSFCVLTKKLLEKDQVLWAFKSFSMGWWRRRRILLQDLGSERLYATELGCDPQGNPLKRSFLSAAREALQSIPATAPREVAAVRVARRTSRGSAWGAALAVIMAFGFLGTIMALELASRCDRLNRGAPHSVAPDNSCGLLQEGEQDSGVEPTLPVRVMVTPAAEERRTQVNDVEPAESNGSAEPRSMAPRVPPRTPDSFTPDEPLPDRLY